MGYFRGKFWQVLRFENFISAPGEHAASASSRCSLSEIFKTPLFQSFALQSLLFLLLKRHYSFSSVVKKLLFSFFL